MAKKKQPLLREAKPSPPWRVVLTAFASFGCGLALVGATFGEVPDETGGLGAGDEGIPVVEPAEAPPEETELETRDTPTIEEVTPTIETPEEAPEELAVIPAELAAGTPSLEGAALPQAVEAPAVEVAEELPAPIPSDTRFVRGRLAYLRCGAMADADGRCPRDRDLEASTWTVLEAANTCGLGSGSADVRLHFSGGAPELRFRDFGDAPLALGALQACLAPRVAPLRSTLGEAFILSVRFELR